MRRPAANATRGVAPREVLVVELDERQVVRLEVRDPVPRLGAHERLEIEPDDVAGAVQLYGAGPALRVVPPPIRSPLIWTRRDRPRILTAVS